ncbi:MAG: TIGR04086 family membrane protein [Clostridiales bacterium]|nr:TIGR04086 family membrane protein [Clostridiales bacterium]
MFKGNGRANIKPFVFSAAIGLIITAILLIIFAFLMSGIDLPEGIEAFFSALSLCIGAYFSGFIIGKLKRALGLISGIKCGIIIFAVILIISIFTGGFSGKLIIVKLIICLGGSAFGGIIGVNSRFGY